MHVGPLEAENEPASLSPGKEGGSCADDCEDLLLGVRVLNVQPTRMSVPRCQFSVPVLVPSAQFRVFRSVPSSALRDMR